MLVSATSSANQGDGEATLVGQVDGTVTRPAAIRLLLGPCPSGQQRGSCAARANDRSPRRQPDRGVGHKHEPGRLTATDALAVIRVPTAPVEALTPAAAPMLACSSCGTGSSDGPF